MNIKDVKNTPKLERKSVVLSVRVTPKELEFLKDNQISISKICNCALKELGFKEMLKSAGIMLLTVFIVGGLLNLTLPL